MAIMPNKPDDKQINQAIQPVLEYIRQYGKLAGCTTNSTISRRTLLRWMEKGGKYYKPEVANAVDLAFETYRKTHRHPSEDPEIRRDVLEQFRLSVRSGQCKEQLFMYDEKDRLKSKVFKQPGVSQWVFDRVFPPQTVTEQAILTVCSNQLQDVAESGLPEELKNAVLKWLSDWMRRAKEELHLHGLKTRYLED